MKNQHSARKRGFTLIELLVVILILAILAALIVPRIVNRQDDAKVAAAKSDIRTLSNELNKFKLDTGRFPTTEEGLQSLRSQPNDADGWKGPYLEKDIPLDPWQNDYVYEFPGPDGSDFLIESYGSDRAAGGEGTAADISNLD